MKQQPTNILIVTSSLAASANDAAVSFVNDQAAALKNNHPELTISILAPHNSYVETKNNVQREAFTEYRFHYFWPFKLELLAGRGIAPALKAHKWLYLAVPFLFLFEALAIYRTARRLKPDMIYVHWFTPQAVSAVPAARLLKLPLFCTTHASDVAVWKTIPGGKKIVQYVSRKLDGISAVSKQTADRLRYFWPDKADDLEAKLSIIPMGTDEPLNPSTESAKLYPGKQVVMYVGRLVERKGVADLINAFKHVQTTAPNALLVIAGDGQDKQRFEKLAHGAELGDSCVFTGFVSGQKKADLFARADILCIPSINEGVNAEGLPVVFMEGLAAGKIVIASNVTGAQEHVTSGINGFIVPERDSTVLASTLEQVLALPAADRKAIQKAAKQLGQSFSWPKVAEQQYTVLSNVYRSYHDSKS